jgi:hypothetical protein
LKQKLCDAVRFDDKSHGNTIIGGWPAWAYSVVSPRDDPITFWRNHTDVFGMVDTLTREHFSAPRILFWAPELRWPQFYPAGRPACRWHKNTNCVIHNGWTNRPRAAVNETETCALWPKGYLCSIRQKAGEHPYSFYGYDPAVIECSDIYVQRYWRQFGANLTWRSGVQWTILDQMRSSLAHGLGAAGFRKILAEKHRMHHLDLTQMWRGYVNYRHRNPALIGNPVERVMFFDFDSRDYIGKIPSLSWLLDTLLDEIEKRIPFYTRCLQMQDGLELAGDHSHKYCKLIFVFGGRAFEGLYTLMNGVGKIVGFWFTSGTSLEELETVARGVARRYKMHGFEGPLMLTCDRCCDERNFWAGTRNKEKSPIFESLARQGISIVSDVEEGPHLALPHVPLVVPRTETDNVCAMIMRAAEAQSLDGTAATACVSVDCEWSLGSKGPNLVQIGLPDGRTFLFQLRLLKSPPVSSGLKNLLEADTIKKVGNRIHNDVRQLAKVNIQMQPTIELGHVAKDRGVSNDRAPSLSLLVSDLFSCVLPKGNVRTSNWAAEILSEDQIKYAALDAYASISVYKKLFFMLSVRTTPAPDLASLVAGVRVAVFSRNLGRRVADGTVHSVRSDKLVSVTVLKSDICVMSAVMTASGDTIGSIADGCEGDSVELTCLPRNLRLISSTAQCDVQVHTCSPPPLSYASTSQSQHAEGPHTAACSGLRAAPPEAVQFSGGSDNSGDSDFEVPDNSRSELQQGGSQGDSDATAGLPREADSRPAQPQTSNSHVELDSTSRGVLCFSARRLGIFTSTLSCTSGRDACLIFLASRIIFLLV